MISVVICFQSVMGFLYRPTVCFAHLFEFRHKVLSNLLLGNAADRCVFGHEADVGQIVEHREEGYLCEFGDAGDENEFLECITSLQYGKHIPINIGAISMFGCHP